MRICADVRVPKRNRRIARRTRRSFGARWMRFAPFVLLATLMALAASPARAQVSSQGGITARHATYLELAGTGGLFSLNHEYLIRDRVSLRGGFTSWGVESFDGLDENLDAAILGASRHFDASDVFGGEGRLIEVGMAVLAGRYSRRSFGEVEREGAFATLSPQLGVRLQRPRGGFFLRATATPMIHLLNADDAFPTSSPTMAAGISLGYAY